MELTATFKSEPDPIMTFWCDYLAAWRDYNSVSRSRRPTTPSGQDTVFGKTLPAYGFIFYTRPNLKDELRKIYCPYFEMNENKNNKSLFGADKYDIRNEQLLVHYPVTKPITPPEKEEKHVWIKPRQIYKRQC